MHTTRQITQKQSTIHALASRHWQSHESNILTSDALYKYTAGSDIQHCLTRQNCIALYTPATQYTLPLPCCFRTVGQARQHHRTHHLHAQQGSDISISIIKSQGGSNT
jgi:hypothetical protein